jgi:hypothetical protein
MTVDGCHAVFRTWGMRHMMQFGSGATLWMDRYGQQHHIRNLTTLSPDERRDYLRELAKQLGEALPAVAAA